MSRPTIPGPESCHCVLVKTDGLLVIRDLATTNGTRVKGQRIRWAALPPDDKNGLGGAPFRGGGGLTTSLSPSERAAEGLCSARQRAPRRVRVPTPILVAEFPHEG